MSSASARLGWFTPGATGKSPAMRTPNLDLRFQDAAAPTTTSLIALLSIYFEGELGEDNVLYFLQYNKTSITIDNTERSHCPLRASKQSVAGPHGLQSFASKSQVIMSYTSWDVNAHSS